MLALTVLTLLAAAQGPEACPEALSLSDALERVDALPVVGGYADARRARQSFDNRISYLHGQTSVQANPGYRLFPFDQIRPEGYVGISHTALLGNLGGARKRVAEAEQAALLAVADSERVERRLGVAELWLRRWSADAAVKLVTEQLEAAEALEQRVARARELGALSQADLLWARTRVHSRRLALQQVEGSQVDTGLALADAVACPQPRPVGALGQPWTTLGEHPGLQALSASGGEPPQAGASPQTEALRAQSRAVVERQALASVQQRPALTLGLTAEVDADNTLRTLVGIGGSWNLFEGDYLARGQSAADLALLEARLAERTLHERHLAAALAHEHEHQTEALALIEEHLLPDARALEAATLAAFDVGEATANEVLQAKAARAEAEQLWLDVRVALAGNAVRARLWAQVPPMASTKETQR